MYIFWKIDYFYEHFQVHSKVEWKIQSRISLLRPPPAFSVTNIPQRNGSFSVTDELTWTHQSPKVHRFHQVSRLVVSVVWVLDDWIMMHSLLYSVTECFTVLNPSNSAHLSSPQRLTTSGLFMASIVLLFPEISSLLSFWRHFCLSYFIYFLIDWKSWHFFIDIFFVFVFCTFQHKAFCSICIH